MTMRQVCMVGRFFVTTRFMVLGRLNVMMLGVSVMFRSLAVVLGSLL
jgi:hypothetical protein